MDSDFDIGDIKNGAYTTGRASRRCIRIRQSVQMVKEAKRTVFAVHETYIYKADFV